MAEVSRKQCGPSGLPYPKGPSHAFRSPYAEEFLEAAAESSPFPWLSPALTGSVLLCPLRANMTALQSLLRGSLAITTTGLTPAVSAFQGTPALGQAPAPHLRDLINGWPKRRRWDGLPGRFRRLEPCFLRLENLG